MSTNTMKTCVALLFATGILAFSGLMPLAWPQVGPSSQEWTDVFKASQPDSGTAFLEVGKKYEFTPSSKWAVFQAKVVAIRGDQWVRVVEMQMEGSNNLGPTWVNLHQMAFISEIAAEGNKNQRDLLKK